MFNAAIAELFRVHAWRFGWQIRDLLVEVLLTLLILDPLDVQLVRGQRGLSYLRQNRSLIMGDCRLCWHGFDTKA